MVRTVIKLYKEKLFVGPSGIFDNEKTKKQIPAFKNKLRFLNCSWFIKGKCTSAIEKECEADHMTALASDQLKCFQDAMSKARTTNIDNNSDLSPNERVGLQRLFMWHLPRMQQIEELTFKSENHDEYVRLHAKKADEMKDKASGFMYVRAKDHSDYDKFILLIKLLTVTPCDHLQAI
jgi:hypothetical protein